MDPAKIRAAAVVLAGLAFAGAVLRPLRVFVGKAATMHRESVETYQPRLVTAHWLNAAIPGGLRALQPVPEHCNRKCLDTDGSAAKPV